MASAAASAPGPKSLSARILGAVNQLRDTLSPYYQGSISFTRSGGRNFTFPVVKSSSAAVPEGFSYREELGHLKAVLKRNPQILELTLQMVGYPSEVYTIHEAPVAATVKSPPPWASLWDLPPETSAAAAAASPAASSASESSPISAKNRANIDSLAGFLRLEPAQLTEFIRKICGYDSDDEDVGLDDGDMELVNFLLPRLRLLDDERRQLMANTLAINEALLQLRSVLDDIISKAAAVKAVDRTSSTAAGGAVEILPVDQQLQLIQSACEQLQVLKAGMDAEASVRALLKDEKAASGSAKADSKSEEILRKQLTGVNRALSVVTGKLKDLEQKLAAREARIRELEAAALARQAAEKKAAEQLAQTLKAQEILEARVVEAQGSVADARKAVVKEREAKTSAEARVAELKTQLAVVEAKLRESEASKAEALIRIATLEAGLTEMHAALAQVDEARATVETALARDTLALAVRGMTTTLGAQTATIEAQAAELARLRATLEAKLAESTDREFVGLVSIAGESVPAYVSASAVREARARQAAALAAASGGHPPTLPATGVVWYLPSGVVDVSPTAHGVGFDSSGMGINKTNVANFVA